METLKTLLKNKLTNLPLSSLAQYTQPPRRVGGGGEFPDVSLKPLPDLLQTQNL